ncbi:MAG: paraquat-inducible protein A [Candidatus Endonucleobacter bathymodioli]|uniref:Paraquat-inducible protein A n=1 Tax=Candidatus Endonucleibacter bathymodioli TaxID=539814 RepID=A0AA90STY2_9GAMM|nr:paraquat-inducible protein A [Candidatus Endonucleobacter bathymodioli]
MKTQKIYLLLAALLSATLLVPGITQPLITLQADMNRQAIVNEGKRLVGEQSMHPTMASMATQFLDGLKVQGTTNLYNKTRSIFGTAEDLWKSGHLLVALLIVIFSIIIPATKTLLILIACMIKNTSALIRLNSFLSKWSMADVFAIGVIVACLASNSTSSQKALITFNAQLHAGFYWFLGYCLASIAVGQLLVNIQPTATKPMVINKEG